MCDDSERNPKELLGWHKSLMPGQCCCKHAIKSQLGWQEDAGQPMQASSSLCNAMNELVLGQFGWCRRLGWAKRGWREGRLEQRDGRRPRPRKGVKLVSGR